MGWFSRYKQRKYDKRVTNQAAFMEEVWTSRDLAHVANSPSEEPYRKAAARKVLSRRGEPSAEEIVAAECTMILAQVATFNSEHYGRPRHLDPPPDDGS